MCFKKILKNHRKKNEFEEQNKSKDKKNQRKSRKRIGNTDEQAVLQSLNIPYQAAEQSRSNYYWVSNWRNAFFKLLGINENLEYIEKHIMSFSESDSDDSKEFFSGAILERKKYIDRDIAKDSLPKSPAKIELKDVFEELNIPKSTEIEKVNNYIASQKKCFAKYSDDSDALRITQEFVLAFLQFWEGSGSLLDKKEEESYCSYMKQYAAFQETDAYKQIMNKEGDGKDE